MRRLSADWEAVYGHPILIAETFVDTSRFRGTCYKAAGFIPLGETRGFRRNGGKYYLHGQPKTILAISVCAVLSGAKTYIAIAEWAARCSQSMLAKLWCPKSNETGKWVPPSEPTIRRFMGEADAESVDITVDAWLEREATRSKRNKKRTIAIDGKTLKASARKGKKQVHLLSAFLHHQQVVIARVQVDVKSNEIPAVKSLLKPLDIEGAVVTADAMHTQKDTA